MRSGTTATLTIKENQLKKREEIEPTRSTFWPPDGSNNKIITTMVIVRVKYYGFRVRISADEHKYVNSRNLNILEYSRIDQ